MKRLCLTELHLSVGTYLDKHLKAFIHILRTYVLLCVLYQDCCTFDWKLLFSTLGYSCTKQVFLFLACDSSYIVCNENISCT